MFGEPHKSSIFVDKAKDDDKIAPFIQIIQGHLYPLKTPRFRMTPYRTLLLNFYRAYNSRRLDDAIAVLHPEVDWAEGRDGGRILGRQNVKAQWIRQWTGLTPHVEPVGFDLDDHGRTVVRVHQYLRDFEGDIIAKGFIEHAFHICDGLITRMDFVSS